MRSIRDTHLKAGFELIIQPIIIRLSFTQQMILTVASCPTILRDHFAVQVASIDSLEKQRLTIEKILQANVHGSKASPVMLMPLPRPREAGEAAREKQWEQVREV